METVSMAITSDNQKFPSQDPEFPSQTFDSGTRRPCDHVVGKQG